jgi:predicted enzyme related to lactoylglutathione lyase
VEQDEMRDELNACKICHIEIPASDLQVASDFYTAVFGWIVEKDHPTQDYWFFDDGSLRGAFVRKAGPADDIGVKLFLKTDDIDRTLDDIRRHKGIVVRTKHDIGGEYGYSAFFKDPSGNHLGLWSSQ